MVRVLVFGACGSTARRRPGARTELSGAVPVTDPPLTRLPTPGPTARSLSFRAGEEIQRRLACLMNGCRDGAGAVLRRPGAAGDGTAGRGMQARHRPPPR